MKYQNQYLFFVVYFMLMVAHSTSSWISIPIIVFLCILLFFSNPVKKISTMLLAIFLAPITVIDVATWVNLASIFSSDSVPVHSDERGLLLCIKITLNGLLAAAFLIRSDRLRNKSSD
jgi:hypothetical protein